MKARAGSQHLSLAVFAPALGWRRQRQNRRRRRRSRLSEPLGPQRVVRTVSGYCGPHRFQVVLRMDERAPEARVEVDVNGDAIPGSERARLIAQLPDGAHIMDASIAECERDEPAAKARVRLLIQEPSRGPAPRFLEFWVSPSGGLSGIGFN